MSDTFPKINNGAKAHIDGKGITFTYMNSFSDVITETKPILTPSKIKQKVVDRMERFHDAGPGTRESEISRAERKWISAHPVSLLQRVWDKLDEHGRMEMSMMLSEKSHYGISDPSWAKAHKKEREAIMGDNMVPL